MRAHALRRRFRVHSIRRGEIALALAVFVPVWPIFIDKKHAFLSAVAATIALAAN